MKSTCMRKIASESLLKWRPTTIAFLSHIRRSVLMRSSDCLSNNNNINKVIKRWNDRTSHAHNNRQYNSKNISSSWMLMISFCQCANWWKKDVKTNSMEKRFEQKMKLTSYHKAWTSLHHQLWSVILAIQHTQKSRIFVLIGLRGTLSIEINWR